MQFLCSMYQHESSFIKIVHSWWSLASIFIKESVIPQMILKFFHLEPVYGQQVRGKQMPSWHLRK